jgi:hypothetical protein
MCLGIICSYSNQYVKNTTKFKIAVLTTNVGQNVGGKEPSYTASGNVN